MNINYSYYNPDTGVLVTCYLTDTRVFGDETGYVINEIQTNRADRGKGHASRVMRHVCAEADKEGATLILNVAPDHSLGSLNFDQLVAWYERLGFVWCGSESHDMIRYPRREGAK